MSPGKALVALLATTTAAAADDRTTLDLEVDPLTFANLGYGVQIGARLPALRGVRLSIASFSLHVPDLVTELGGNDGFDLRVRPSGALYGLYYFRPAQQNGFCVGASIRYLRLRYERDDTPGERAEISELSPEVIAGYMWHPFKNGFYLQPWVAFGVTVWRSAEPTVGARTYDELPISPFFTVNVGYEHSL